MTDPIASLADKLRDKWWRMTHLYLIRTGSGKVEVLKPNANQIEFHRNRHTRNFVPKARKLGMSTFIVLDYLDTCLFPPLDDVGRPVIVEAGHVDLTQPNAFKKLDMARLAWNRGPTEHPDPHMRTLWKAIHKANPLEKDAGGLLSWANGSRQEAGVTFTGTTPLRLHVSEFGPISSRSPAKASEIMTGPMEAVLKSGIIDIETTMRAGQYGECFGIFELAKATNGAPKSELDWMLHFFSWLAHPDYDLPGLVPHNAATIEYFAGLERSHGLIVPLSRQAWYEAKGKTLRDKIFQEFPTVIDELSRASVPGQIYPEMTRVRVEGRVRAFNMEVGPPTFTSWDLGSSDNMAGWFLQPAGKDHNFLDWTAGEGQGAAAVAMKIREWEAAHGPIAMNFIPHDAEITDKGSGKTYVSQLVECGIPRNKICVVPRIPDLWVGVDEVRKILPNCWFHERCDQKITTETGGKLPGGVGRLEGYRKRIDHSTGIPRDVPVKDWCDHTADALRTYAEALSRNLVIANIRTGRGATVVGGFRGQDAPVRRATVIG